MLFFEKEDKVNTNETKRLEAAMENMFTKNFRAKKITATFGNSVKLPEGTFDIKDLIKNT